MGRYLDDQTLNTYLNLGKRVEVFLGRDKLNPNIINHLDIYKEDKTIKVNGSLTVFVESARYS